MSVEECVPGGLTVGKSGEMIRMFVQDGLDIIHVSGGGIDTGPRMIEEAAKGNLIRLAGQIRKDADIPVIAVGGILDLGQAERALEEEQADMVALGRALIADPELVTKTLDGRVEDVVECTSCLKCFVPRDKPGLTCSVNEEI